MLTPEIEVSVCALRGETNVESHNTFAEMEDLPFFLKFCCGFATAEQFELKLAETLCDVERRAVCLPARRCLSGPCCVCVLCVDCCEQASPWLAPTRRLFACFRV